MKNGLSQKSPKNKDAEEEVVNKSIDWSEMEDEIKTHDEAFKKNRARLKRLREELCKMGGRDILRKPLTIEFVKDLWARDKSGIKTVTIDDVIYYSKSRHEWEIACKVRHNDVLEKYDVAVRDDNMKMILGLRKNKRKKSTLLNSKFCGPFYCEKIDNWIYL